MVSVFESVPSTAAVLRADEPLPNEAELAAVAFLARYSGRTLVSYRADLRQYLAWIAPAGVPPLQATRAHLELYRSWMEQRGLAAATVDRRLSTVCGYYRFAHLDGRIAANPAQHVRRPQVHSSTQREGPWRAGRVPVLRGAGLADARRLGGAVGVERATGQRSMRRQR